MMILPVAPPLPHLEPAVVLQDIYELSDFGRHARTKRLTSELTGTHRQGAARRMLPRTACGALPVRGNLLRFS